MLPLRPILSAIHLTCADCQPAKSQSRVVAQGALATESNATTLMPASQAFRITPFSAVSDAASIAMALTCLRMRSLICCICWLTVLSPLRMT